MQGVKSTVGSKYLVVKYDKGRNEYLDKAITRFMESLGFELDFDRKNSNIATGLCTLPFRFLGDMKQWETYVNSLQTKK